MGERKLVSAILLANGRPSIMHDDVTPADLAAHLRTLPHAEQVAALVALLRACPDAAVEAVDTCKVARAWSPPGMSRAALNALRHVASCDEHGVRRHIPWGQGYYLGVYETAKAGGAAIDAALVADGWVLANGGVK